MTRDALGTLGDAVGSLDKRAINCRNTEEYIAGAEEVFRSFGGRSYPSDEFFRQVSGVLAAISDIVTDPCLSAESREEICLAANARPLSPRDFNATVRDGALWRRKGGGISPERVHVTNFGHTILNAENAFVARLIAELSSMLGKYCSVCSEAAKSIGDDGALKENSQAFVQAYMRLNHLHAKARRLMNTPFYRQLSAASDRGAELSASNVLCHEPRYRKCYKFYLRRHICADQTAILSMLSAYYSALLAVRLWRLGYIVESKGEPFDAYTAFVRPVRFLRGDFEITLTALPCSGGARVDVYNRKFAPSRFNPSAGIVFFGEETDAERETFVKQFSAVTVAAISGSRYVRLDGGESTVCGLQGEDETADRYIADRTACARAEEGIYSRLCPNCRGTSVTLSDGLYTCPDCGAAYAFSGGEMWMVRQGRVNI